jgi:hypothetical protein
MKRIAGYILIFLSSILFLWPVLAIGSALYLSSPDILYVKAKVLQVSLGHLFADPITGLPTMHPPWYHALLGLLGSFGIGIDTALLLATIWTVAGTVTFSFLVIRSVYGFQAAIGTIFALPFVIQFMGPQNFLLPSSFYVSLPLFLCGWWLLTMKTTTKSGPAIAAISLAAAFLISPIYLFAIIFLLLISAKQLLRSGNFWTFLFLLAFCLIAFFVQTITVLRAGMWPKEAFSLWHGATQITDIRSFAANFLSPIRKQLLSIPALLHASLLGCFILVSLRNRGNFRYGLLLFAVYLLTYCFYGPQYGVRIQFLFSLVIVAAIAAYPKDIAARSLALVPLALLMILGWYSHLQEAIEVRRIEETTRPDYEHQGQGLWSYFERFVPPNTVVFASKDNYLQYIMPFFPVHALGAYRTLEYYQVPRDTAEQRDADYQRIISADQYPQLAEVAAKHDITTAVIGTDELRMNWAKLFVSHWSPVYADSFFVIVKRL